MEENGEADEGDDTKSEAYSEKTTKSIKTVLSQRSAKTSASSGKYSELNSYINLVLLDRLQRFKKQLYFQTECNRT